MICSATWTTHYPREIAQAWFRKEQRGKKRRESDPSNNNNNNLSTIICAGCVLWDYNQQWWWRRRGRRRRVVSVWKEGRIWICFSQPRSSSRKNSDCTTWAFNGHTELTARVHRRRQNKIVNCVRTCACGWSSPLKVVTYVYPHICLSSITYTRSLSSRARSFGNILSLCFYYDANFAYLSSI